MSRGLKVAVLFAAAQLVRPERANPPTDPSRTIQAHLGTTGGLGAVLDRSCGEAAMRSTVNGQMRVRDYLSLTVSFDHHMIDGAPAARFTERLKQLIESGYGLQDTADSAMDRVVGGRPGVVTAPR